MHRDVPLAAALVFLGLCILAFAVAANGGNAGWLALLGSLIAATIAGMSALGATWLTDKKNREREALAMRREGISLALAIGPELAEMENRIRNSFHHYQKYAAHEASPNFGKIRIPIPPVLTGSVGRFHVLGEKACQPVQQLVACIGRYNRIIDRIDPATAPSEPTPRDFTPPQPDLKNLLGPHINLIRELIADALVHIQPVHEAVLDTD